MMQPNAQPRGTYVAGPAGRDLRLGSAPRLLAVLVQPGQTMLYGPVGMAATSIAAPVGASVFALLCLQGTVRFVCGSPATPALVTVLDDAGQAE